MKTSFAEQQHHDQAIVLTKAIINLANFYSLTGKHLHDIIGISESTVTRLHQGKKLLSPDTKEGQIALLLVRVYRNLQSLMGGDHHKALLWLKSENLYFGAQPLDQMTTIPGLVAVLNYLDAMRGKL